MHCWVVCGSRNLCWCSSDIRVVTCVRAPGLLRPCDMEPLAITAVSSAARQITWTNTVAPRATVLDTLALFADVVLPNVAKGTIMRRPGALKIAERLGLDHRAVRRLLRIRNKYGSDPLLLRVPGRSLALILRPEHARRLLQETPEPFATATQEKNAALAHFSRRVFWFRTGQSESSGGATTRRCWIRIARNIA